MVFFHIDNFCYLHMETLHITESVSKCKHVYSITLTHQFLQIEIQDIVCFHECKILWDFAIICFRQNTQLKKYCTYFLRRKMIETRLTRSSHKILHSFQVLSSNSKIFRKFELNVNCLNNLLEWFSKSFPTHYFLRRVTELKFHGCQFSRKNLLVFNLQLPANIVASNVIRESAV